MVCSLHGVTEASLTSDLLHAGREGKVRISRGMVGWTMGGCGGVPAEWSEGVLKGSIRPEAG